MSLLTFSIVKYCTQRWMISVCFKDVLGVCLLAAWLILSEFRSRNRYLWKALENGQHTLLYPKLFVPPRKVRRTVHSAPSLTAKVHVCREYAHKSSLFFVANNSVCSGWVVQGFHCFSCCLHIFSQFCAPPPSVWAMICISKHNFLSRTTAFSASSEWNGCE